LTVANCILLFELQKEIAVRITGVDNVDHYPAVMCGTLRHDTKASPLFMQDLQLHFYVHIFLILHHNKKVTTISVNKQPFPYGESTNGN